MNALKQNWFSEVDEELWPDCCFSLKCDEVLYDQKSKYQHVQVFKKYILAVILTNVIQNISFINNMNFFKQNFWKYFSFG